MEGFLLAFMAVDIGGTFTDLVGYDPVDSRFFQAKSPTTPDDFSQGIVDCIDQSGLDLADVDVLIHGTTVAINTLIERTGAKTALLVTRGTRDVYIIGRGNRPQAYNLFFHRHRPLVSRRLTFELGERMQAGGDVLRPLDPAQVEACARTLAEEGVEAVAVCLLHAYANPTHEIEAGRILRRLLPDCFVSLSHEILRAYREYERISTTVVNAYVGPRVSGYLENLERRLKGIGYQGSIAIMQSNGGIMSPGTARRRPATMMESGPVGGIIASAEVGRALGFPNVIAFDMGGTTAKASLVRDSEPTHAEGYYVGGYASGDPVILPVIDVVEVGAGGGSIAWIDDVGALKVGPHSAGADPGPICYRRGGELPTITDANVALGRIGSDEFLGGRMQLDADAARHGVEDRLGRDLGMPVPAIADAILRIAVNKMSLAVREVSVAKGYDPRDFALVASGGAGPLHAVAIARELHIPTVIVPRFPAHFSALGMLMADERHDIARTFLATLADVDAADLIRIHDEMVSDARAMLRDTEDVAFLCSLDLRYVGQEFSIAVPVDRSMLAAARFADIRARFDALHERRYAHHAADEPVEMVNMRLAAVGQRPSLDLPVLAAPEGQAEAAHRPILLDDWEAPVDCPVYRRDTLPAGSAFDGPALVQEQASTTVLFDGDRCEVAGTGELIVTVGKSR